jgi:DNA-binding response OmpR family regulator
MWQGEGTVTEHVRRVRLKIESDARRPAYLATVRGVGYRLDAPSFVAELVRRAA